MHRCSPRQCDCLLQSRGEGGEGGERAAEGRREMRGRVGHGEEATHPEGRGHGGHSGGQGSGGQLGRGSGRAWRQENWLEKRAAGERSGSTATASEGTVEVDWRMEGKFRGEDFKADLSISRGVCEHLKWWEYSAVG